MFRNLLPFILFSLVLRSNAQLSHNVDLLDTWTNESLQRNNDGTIFNGCWGFEYNGKEYAVIGSTAGTHIFLINENDRLIEVDFVPGTSIHTTSSNNIHREFKTYKNYLYGVCDEGNSTLQIMDMSTLPDSVTLLANNNDFFFRAHDMFVDTAMGNMYVCGPRDTAGLWGMRVLSLDDPVNPALLYTYTDTWYVHGAFVRNDTAWLNCANDGVRIYKFTDGTNPVLLNYIDYYWDKGYNHSGWLHDNNKYYVFTDETPGMRIKLVDVHDVTDPIFLDLFNSEGDENTIAHVVMWKGDYIYASHYYDGLQVFDARNKADVKRIAWYDTHTENSTMYSGAWGVYCFYKDNKVIISDRNSGLFLFRVNYPPEILAEQEHGVYPNPASGETYFYYTNETSLYYDFSVYDASGKLVWEKKNVNSNFLRFDVSQWSAGTYFYQWKGIESDVLLKGKFVVAGE